VKILIKNKIVLALVFALSIFVFGAELALAEEDSEEGSATTSEVVSNDEAEGFVAVIDMKMLILPGTLGHLKKSIEKAETQGAKVIVVLLDTPGGMLNTSQDMIQSIFASSVPIAVFVSPAGASATSAGVFITQAAHIAAMAPGTSIGAAKPVMGDGGDIQGDMKTKAENMTIAMVKSISEERGRNVEWAEESIRESSSITEREALEKNVIDIIASDINDLLKQMEGKEIKVLNEVITLGNYSRLERREFEIGLTDRLVNVLANPNIAALLWLGATTGLTLELYNPGAILPGVVGVICLILALAVSQIIPISQGGVLLLIVGTLLLVAEVYVGSGILAVGGIIAIILGAIYLVDVTQAPGLQVSLEFFIPVALVLGGLLLVVMRMVVAGFKKPVVTGYEGMVGLTGKAMENFSDKGRVWVNGEIWKARLEGEGIVEKDSQVEVVRINDGFVLDVRKK